MHAPVAALFVALALALTWPLPVRMATHLPGTALDDNVMFLWNFWWMREALADPARAFFQTSHQFHPWGVHLALHTHTALNAFIGATVLGAAPLPVALNLTLLAGTVLNGFSAYLLAYRVSLRRFAAIVGGVFFAASPTLVSHLHGHFNLYAAWVLVFFALACLPALERGSRMHAAAAGALFAAVAYTDYYYFVYACVFLVCVLVHRLLAPAVITAPRRPLGRLDAALLVVAGGAALVALLVWWTGGFVIRPGGVRISLTTGTNVRALACAAFLAWLWRIRRPQVTWHLVRERVTRDARVTGILCAVALVCVAPLIAAALELWRGGHYVSQTYLWRSAPAGADLATIALGNPFNGIWGAAVMDLYGDLGMNAFAGPLWLGVAPVVLIATRRAWMTNEASRLWVLVTAVFLVWALGPYLLLFGMNTGLPLPQVLLRFLPILSNARIPGHAAIFVALGAAVLLALSLASWRPHRPVLAISALLVLIAADFWAAPIPLVVLDRPPIYERLLRLPPGAVLELPLGIRDGFGEEGRLDPSVFLHQTIHGRPILSGYVSRLSPVLRARYRDSAVLEALLRLSAGERPSSLPEPQAVTDVLRSSGVAYVVVDERTASAPLLEFVSILPLRLIDEDDQRQLFALQ